MFVKMDIMWRKLIAQLGRVVGNCRLVPFYRVCFLDKSKVAEYSISGID